MGEKIRCAPAREPAPATSPTCPIARMARAATKLDRASAALSDAEVGRSMDFIDFQLHFYAWREAVQRLCGTMRAESLFGAMWQVHLLMIDVESLGGDEGLDAASQLEDDSWASTRRRMASKLYSVLAVLERAAGVPREEIRLDEWMPRSPYPLSRMASALAAPEAYARALLVERQQGDVRAYGRPLATAMCSG